MKKILVILFLLLISCNNDDDFNTDTVVGTWEITDRLADPGDGSGVFRPLSSGKRLQFNADGTFSVTRGTLCGIANDENGNQTGTYSLEDSTISISCEGFPEQYGVGFELISGRLVLNYLCIEPCAERYRKIGD